MSKRITVALILFILLTTIIFEPKIVISKFNVEKIIIENNSLLKEKDIKMLLSLIYGKNLIFLKNTDIQKALERNDFIESFNVKKKYPSTLKIKIFEYKPIAILIDRKKKFYMNKEINVIKFKNYEDYENLPYVFGNVEEFKIFYKNLPWSKFSSTESLNKSLERNEFVMMKKEEFKNNLLDLENVELYLFYKYIFTNNTSNILPNYNYIINSFKNLLIL